MNQPKANASDDLFTTETAGLPEVLGPDVTRLHDGDRLDLRIGPVRKNIDGAELRMLAYNGSIPGPVLHVDQGSEITVHAQNDGDVEATVHWHGLRLENQYDGVPDETQVPIPIGGTYTCKLRFPDAGFYWYHPHIREDFGLEMGLYGTIVVGGLDHDRAVQPHLQAEVLADVRVVPVEPGVREPELARVRPADRDRYLGLIGHTVVLVLQPQAMPVHGRLDIPVVLRVHGDLRALIDVQGRAGDRPVVGEHPQLGAVDVLAHRADPQIQPVPVVKPGHVRTQHLRQSRRLGREQVVACVRFRLVHLAPTLATCALI